MSVLLLALPLLFTISYGSCPICPKDRSGYKSPHNSGWIQNPNAKVQFTTWGQVTCKHLDTTMQDVTDNAWCWNAQFLAGSAGCCGANWNGPITNPAVGCDPCGNKVALIGNQHKAAQTNIVGSQSCEGLYKYGKYVLRTSYMCQVISRSPWGSTCCTNVRGAEGEDEMLANAEASLFHYRDHRSVCLFGGEESQEEYTLLEKARFHGWHELELASVEGEYPEGVAAGYSTSESISREQLTLSFQLDNAWAFHPVPTLIQREGETEGSGENNTETVTPSLELHDETKLVCFSNKLEDCGKGQWKLMRKQDDGSYSAVATLEHVHVSMDDCAAVMNEATQNDDDEKSNAALIVIVVVAILALLVLACVFFFLLKRRNEAKRVSFQDDDRHVPADTQLVS